MSEIKFEDIFYTGEGKTRKGAMSVSETAISFSTSGSNSHTIPKEDIDHIEYSEQDVYLPNKKTRRMMVVYSTKDKRHKYANFSSVDREKLITGFQKNMSIDIQIVPVSTDGGNWGYFEPIGDDLVMYHTHPETEKKEQMFKIPFEQMQQAVVQGKRESAIEFQQDETGEHDNKHTLAEVRFFFPEQEEELTNVDEEYVSPAQVFTNMVTDYVGSGENSEVITKFDQFTFMVPRGRYSIDICSDYFKMHGNSFNYKIMYTTVTRLFQLDLPDDANTLFVIGLSPPIRQGRTTYPFLILSCKKEEQFHIRLNMEREEIEAKYKDILMPEMRGASHVLFSRIFKAFTSKNVIVPGNFRSFHGFPSIRCSCKANEGYLFMLTKSFFFLRKPTTYIRHDHIASIEFLRMDSVSTTSRYFDLQFNLKDSTKMTFSSINRQEYNNLFDFFVERGLHIENIKARRNQRETGSSSSGRSDRISYADDPGMVGGDDEESDEDEDFDIEEEEASSSSETGSDVEGEVSDVDIKVTSTNKRKKSSNNDNSDNDDDEKEARKKARNKKSAVKSARTAYAFFSKEQRPKLLETNKDLTFQEISKKTGELWQSLTAEAKEPYNDMATKDKVRYSEEYANLPEEERNADAKSKTRKKAATKKKGGPKRARAAYIFFSVSARAGVKADNPSATNKDIMGLVGEKWNSLTAEDKIPFEEQAEKDKIRYQTEMAEFNAKEKEREEEEETRRKKKKKKKKKHKKKKEREAREAAEHSSDDDDDDEEEADEDADDDAMVDEDED